MSCSPKPLNWIASFRCSPLLVKMLNSLKYVCILRLCDFRCSTCTRIACMAFIYASALIILNCINVVCQNGPVSMSYVMKKFSGRREKNTHPKGLGYQYLHQFVYLHSVNNLTAGKCYKVLAITACDKLEFAGIFCVCINVMGLWGSGVTREEGIINCKLFTLKCLAANYVLGAANNTNSLFI